MAWATHTYNSLNGYCGNCSVVLLSKIHIMIENKKVISRSLIVLFLSLSIVYSLTYQKKESLFKSEIKDHDKVFIQTWTQNQNLWFNTQDSDINKDTGSVSITSSVSLWDVEPYWAIMPDTPDLMEPSNSTSRVKMLPGTTEYFGMLDIIGILWENPEYILQDSKWNYFAYYGNHLDFIDTIETLGGNVYEMVTESEILQNQLFGDRVSYINLSMFKDVRVLMVIEMDDEVRLLQVPADKYHYTKDYLKSLFIH